MSKVMNQRWQRIKNEILNRVEQIDVESESFHAGTFIGYWFCVVWIAFLYSVIRLTSRKNKSF